MKRKRAESKSAKTTDQLFLQSLNHDESFNPKLVLKLGEASPLSKRRKTDMSRISSILVRGCQLSTRTQSERVTHACEGRLGMRGCPAARCGLHISVPGQNGDKPKRRQKTVVLCEACKHLFRALILKPLTSRRAVAIGDADQLRDG